jgi:outer membrane immunogenic protein
MAGLAASVSILALASGAEAQDWSGFYFGANLGGAWGSSDASAATSCPAGGYFCAGGAGAINAVAISNSGSGSLSDENVIGGGQLGYNGTAGGFIYGLEVDLQSFSLSASRQATQNYPFPIIAATDAYTISSGLSTDWLMTARGRLGWAVSDVLLYATGGLALTDLKVTSSFRDNITFAGGSGASMFASDSSVKAGWTVGGGAEWALHDGWSVKGEYLYVDFGSVSATGNVTNPPVGGAAANPLTVSEDLSAHIARAGINYRFGDHP